MKATVIERFGARSSPSPLPRSSPDLSHRSTSTLL
jgi:hypothetical protein